MSGDRIPQCKEQNCSPTIVTEHNDIDELRVKFLTTPYIIDKLTVVTPSFKRTDNLYKLFGHYCSMPMKEIIHKIIILWNNVGEPVPDKVTSSAANCTIPVIIKIMPENNLTSRFYVYPEIETAGKPMNIKCV